MAINFPTSTILKLPLTLVTLLLAPKITSRYSRSALIPKVLANTVEEVVFSEKNYFAAINLQPTTILLFSLNLFTMRFNIQFGLQEEFSPFQEFSWNLHSSGEIMTFNKIL